MTANQFHIYLISRICVLSLDLIADKRSINGRDDKRSIGKARNFVFTINSNSIEFMYIVTESGRAATAASFQVSREVCSAYQ